LQRIVFAFRSFFAILFRGQLPADIAQAFGFITPPPPPKPVPVVKPSDGALQILGILQRDARLIDFLMEDISPYSDDQIGAAARNLHDQSRDAEGTFTKLDTNDPATVKLLGNVPAKGKAPGGLLRHKGWRADKIDLPPLIASQNTAIVAPAEVEIE
jgi:hypothetical protein